MPQQNLQIIESEKCTRKRKNRVICLPLASQNYNDIVDSALLFRRSIDPLIEKFPELFPSTIANGYLMQDIYLSQKQSIKIRRIKISGISYTIRPSFMMPYLTGKTDELQHPLFLRKFDIPFWALPHSFGKNPMYFYRIEQHLGRYSIVGTTIRNPNNLPEDIVADEKHSRILGQKVYVATTVAKECILGASIAEDAGEAALTKAYNVFKQETEIKHPDYAPKTVNTDGWKSTQKAWKNLFPLISLISCFLHVYIKIRDRSKKKFKDTFQDLAERLWNCYDANSKASFAQRIRRLLEWAEVVSLPEIMLTPIRKLHQNLPHFTIAYDFPTCHRTSNMLDRLMQRMDRHLFSTQYFHGLSSSAELSIRGWSLLLNFAPSNPYTIRKYNGAQSPAERLNQSRYHDNWLHNLLISASLAGRRAPP